MKLFSKLSIVLLAVFFSVQITLAQYDASPERIDSLKTELRSMPRDSTRMPVLINLWRAHAHRDSDQSFFTQTN